MTDKKKTKHVTKTIKLSGNGIYRCVGALQAAAQERIQSCRQNPDEADVLGAFKLALSDLVEALTALDKQMDLSHVDPYCNSDFSFHEIARIVAFANVAEIKLPTSISHILSRQELDFPLNFLVQVEAVHASFPNVAFEMRHVSSAPSNMDAEIPF